MMLNQYTPEFLIWKYKVELCSRQDNHNWATCPYAHDKEKARRRDPKVYTYASNACPNTMQGRPCPRGDACPNTHSLQEYWLHPDRFRTQMCKNGSTCNRPLCFFAHKAEELRFPETGAADAAPMAFVMQPAAFQARATTPEPAAPAPGQGSVLLGCPAPGAPEAPAPAPGSVLLGCAGSRPPSFTMTQQQQQQQQRPPGLFPDQQQADPMAQLDAQLAAMLAPQQGAGLDAGYLSAACPPAAAAPDARLRLFLEQQRRAARQRAALEQQRLALELWAQELDRSEAAAAAAAASVCSAPWAPAAGAPGSPLCVAASEASGTSTVSWMSSATAPLAGPLSPAATAPMQLPFDQAAPAAASAAPATYTLDLTAAAAFPASAALAAALRAANGAGGAALPPLSAAAAPQAAAWPLADLGGGLLPLQGGFY